MAWDGSGPRPERPQGREQRPAGAGAERLPPRARFGGTVRPPERPWHTAPLLAPVAVMVAALCLAAAPAALAQGTPGASAVLRDAHGTVVGTVLFTADTGGLRITARVRGLPPGGHGFHIHEVGLCTEPDFASAGGHFNPTSAQHGLANPNGPHAGDLPQIAVGPTGGASYSATTARVTLDTGPTALFDADRSSIVVHAGPDDQVTDPAGNSGGRIACGVIARGAVALPVIDVPAVALPATGGGRSGSESVPSAHWPAPAGLAALGTGLLAVGIGSAGLALAAARRGSGWLGGNRR